MVLELVHCHEAAVTVYMLTCPLWVRPGGWMLGGVTFNAMHLSIGTSTKKTPFQILGQIVCDFGSQQVTVSSILPQQPRRLRAPVRQTLQHILNRLLANAKLDCPSIE
jgi:hypothetical protein